MKAWRISKRKYAFSTDGEGAKRTGQRWSKVGVPALYAGFSVAICALEVLVHTSTVVPDDMVLVELELPDDDALYLNTVSSDLPDGWDDLPSSVAAQLYGTQWLQSGSYLGIIVPSAIVPEEKNVVINPLHSSMSRVSLSIVRDFTFDSRLF